MPPTAPTSAGSDRREVCELLSQRDIAITAWSIIRAGDARRSRAQSRIAIINRKLDSLPAASCGCDHRPLPESLVRRPPPIPLKTAQRILASRR